MKKVSLILGALLLVGATSYAKEVVAAPVEKSEEVVASVVVEDVTLITPATVAYTPLYNIYGKVGLDIWSEYDKFKYHNSNVAANKKDTKNLGFEIALEGTRNIVDNFELGLGVAYQNHAKPKSSKEVKDMGILRDLVEIPRFESVPLYAVAKYNFETGTAWKPYLKATLGYSINLGDETVTLAFTNGEVKSKKEFENGLYYGVGAGIEYNNIFADLMYQVNQAKLKVTGDQLGESSTVGKKDLNYSRVTLGFGYKFSY